MTNPNTRLDVLTELGIGPVWQLRAQPLAAASQDEASPKIDSVAPGEEIDAPEALAPAVGTAHDDAPATLLAKPRATDAGTDIALMTWDRLNAAVTSCHSCGLCETRKLALPGSGDRKARWLFVGDGPHYDDDELGEMFAGAAGALLDNMLAALGLQRSQNAYLANVVKCRAVNATGNDRTPAADEVASCMAYLERQIDLIQPSIIVALGKTAGLSLLSQSQDQPAALRGMVHRYKNIPVVVTYHPSWLLNHPSEKAACWRDLCLAMQSQVESEASSSHVVAS